MAAPFFEAVTTTGNLDAITRIASQIDRASPRVRRRFLDLIGGARGLRSLEELTELIDSGQISEALALGDRIGPGLSTAIDQAYRDTGERAAAQLSEETDQVIDFNSLSPRAVATGQATRARLIQQITTGQRLMLSEGIVDGIERGLRPDQIARELRDSIGLTSTQRRAVQNYRQALTDGNANALNRTLRDRRFDARTRRNFASLGEDRIPLTNAQMDRMTERYRERFIAHRANNIARTETQAAVQAADEEMWTQAIEAGDIDPENVRQVWRTASDERVRPSHSAMNGQEQPVGTPFRSGAGNLLRFPSDPAAPASDTVNCRCVVIRTLRDAARR